MDFFPLYTYKILEVAPRQAVVLFFFRQVRGLKGVFGAGVCLICIFSFSKIWLDIVWHVLAIGKNRQKSPSIPIPHTRDCHVCHICWVVAGVNVCKYGSPMNVVSGYTRTKEIRHTMPNSSEQRRPRENLAQQNRRKNVGHGSSKLSRCLLSQFGAKESYRCIETRK